MTATGTPSREELIESVAGALEGHSFAFIRGGHHDEVAAKIVDGILARLAAEPADDGVRQKIARTLYDLNPSYSHTQFSGPEPTGWCYDSPQKQLAFRQADAVLALSTKAKP